MTLYRVANETTPYSTFASSIPAVSSAYGSSNWGDKLAIAALSLALATDDSTYYADAYRVYQSYALTKSNRPWNWDSRYPALYVLFAEVSVARPGLAAGAGLDANVTGWQAECENYFDKMVAGNLGDAYRTNGKSSYIPRRDQALMIRRSFVLAPRVELCVSQSRHGCGYFVDEICPDGVYVRQVVGVYGGFDAMSQ